MAPVRIESPVVQVALDVVTTDEALRIAEAALRAGVDWLEAGTPLITFEGTRCIQALAEAFPGVPILADFKTMDGARRYVLETRDRGGHIATVCAVASDSTVRTAIAAGRETGILVISDLYASPNPAERAVALQGMGIDSVYVHWGSDQRVEMPERDPQADLAPVLDAVSIPVGVGTFSSEEGERAVRRGASIVAIGMPLIKSSDPYETLKEYVDRAKSV